MRNALVVALAACADSAFRSNIRRFLDGLSSDELQFLAEFHGACIVECGGQIGQEQVVMAARLAGAPAGCASPDRDHKMILLHEYLSRAGARRSARHDNLAQRLVAAAGNAARRLRAHPGELPS